MSEELPRGLAGLLAVGLGVCCGIPVLFGAGVGVAAGLALGSGIVVVAGVTVGLIWWYRRRGSTQEARSHAERH